MKRNSILIVLIFLQLGCTKSINVENPTDQGARFLFDAVALLGKNSTDIEEILGKSYMVTGESKSDPTGKSRWHWYKYEKDLSVFFDRDTQNDVATVVNLIFKDDPKDGTEAARILGINLSGHKPTVTDWGKGLKAYNYEGLQDKGKKYHVHFWQNENGEDSIKVGIGEVHE